jgi:capsular exopolysaccharide synthesis family protein
MSSNDGTGATAPHPATSTVLEPTFEESVVAPGVRGTVQATVLAQDALVAEEFRFLSAKVRLIGEKRAFRCIGVVSATAGEGKSTVALGLAGALAREPGARVLLIEGDLKKPSLEAYLDIPRANGVAEWLTGSLAPVPVRKVRPHDFFLLSCGRVPLGRPELLRSRRMTGLIQAARRSFDLVVMDCTPLIPVVDAVLLQDVLDGFLLVIRARQSPRETIERAVERLKPDRIGGVIFNDRAEILPSYDNYGYRKYGGRYGRGD